MSRKLFAIVGAVATLATVSARATPPEMIRLGEISTVTGPIAVLGKEQFMGVRPCPQGAR